MSFASVPLGEIVEINPLHREPVDARTEVSFLGMADVSELGTTTFGEVRPYGEVRTGYTSFRTGDVLVAKITPCFQNGKIAQAQLEREIGAGSTEFHVVRAGKEVDGRYLLRFLRQDWVRVEGELRMTGSGGQRRVPEAYLRDLMIPLPSITKQRRIAAVLDQVDTLRAKRRDAIALLDALTRSLFFEMFGDPASSNSPWDRKMIGELGVVVTGNTPSRARSEYYGDGIEWIKTDNIRPTELNPSAAAERLSAAGESVGRVVPAEAILVTCIAGSPASIGNAALAGRRVAINQQINAFIPEGHLSRFMLEQIRVGKGLIQRKSTGAMTGLVNKSQFSSVTLLVPPMGRQQEFVHRVERVDSERARSVRQLATLDELFTSFQNRAFSGTLGDHEATGEAA
ncbi:restriction endonuclease subunit S [Streptomyces sp. NPDC059906]|uniref:restriction endonuclease subunit S n=1 Tax=Streptomyces sp. NPDC059906 TaxID=3346997 RepID=UPI00365E521C